MMSAAAAALAIALLFLLVRTCGPCSRGPGKGGPEMERPDMPGESADRISKRAKKPQRPETIPIDEDRDIPAGPPKYEGPVDLGTQVEMITK